MGITILRCLLCCRAIGLLLVLFLEPPLSSEVLFTDSAKANTAGVENILRTWQSLAINEPHSSAALWLKKAGEPGYIGDITVDPVIEP
jgi:hypothetical protein